MSAIRKPIGWFLLNVDSPQARGLVGAWGRIRGGDHWQNYSLRPGGADDALLRNFPSPYTFDAGYTLGVDGAQRALKFKGTINTNAFALLPTVPNNSFSFTIWFRYVWTGTGIPDIQNFFDNNHAGGQGFTMQDRPDLGGLLSLYTGNGSVETTVAFGDGKWHHMACTYNGTTGSIYIDGNLNNSASTGSAGTLQPNLTWGIWQNGGIGGRAYTGSLEDPRVYNRVLSATDVEAMYDPKTRWDLQYQPPRRTYSFAGGAPAQAPFVRNVICNQAVKAASTY